MVSPQPPSEATNTVRWLFSPSDGHLWNGQLRIKEGTAYISRQMPPMQQMALSPWSRVRSTAHQVINFPDMAWIRIQSQSTNSPKLQLFTTHRMFSTDHPQKVHTTFNLKLADTENLSNGISCRAPWEIGLFKIGCKALILNGMDFQWDVYF